MSNFWANKLGQQSSAPQPAPVPRVAGPWWAPGSAVAAPVAPVVQQSAQAPTASPTASPAGEQSIGDLLRQGGYSTTKARSNDGLTCPDCGSNNLVGTTSAKDMKHCFDCGWNPRFTQTMAGITATKDVPTYSARVQTMGESNFNPQGIVAHV